MFYRYRDPDSLFFNEFLNRFVDDFADDSRVIGICGQIHNYIPGDRGKYRENEFPEEASYK